MAEIAASIPNLSQNAGPLRRWWSVAVAPWRRWILGDPLRPAMEAAETLVRRWEHIPEEAKPAAFAAIHPLLGRLSARAKSSNGEGLRIGLAEVAAWGAEGALAPLCAEFLHGPPELALRAERALLRMASACAGVDPRLLDRLGEGTWSDARIRGWVRRDAEAAGSIERALARAVEEAEAHGRKSVALAAAVFMDTSRRVAWRRARRGRVGAGLAVALAEGKGLDALVAVLSGSRRPIARLRAWEWLAEEGIGERVAERLRRAGAPIEHELVLSRWHLALHPRRSLVLRRMSGRGRGRITGMLPEGWVYPRLSVEARHGACVLAHADPARASSSLEGALVDADVLVRLSAARHAPWRLAADFCFDSMEPVARGAALRLSRVGVRLPGGGMAPEAVTRVFERLTRSPHESVRRIAAEEESGRLGRGTGWRAGLVLRESLSADREGVLKEVRRAAGEGPEESRVAALLSARRAGLARELEADLIGLLAPGTPPRLAATAAGMLGDAGSPAALAALGAATEWPDARVRANAVQSLGRMAARERGGKASVLVRGLADRREPVDAHRARANLVRAMIEGAPETVPRALNELASMLTDHRPMHRLAGAWVAGRCLPGEGRRRLAEGFVEIAARVERMSREDEDERVRRRASACVARLRAEERSRWAAAVP